MELQAAEISALRNAAKGVSGTPSCFRPFVLCWKVSDSLRNGRALPAFFVVDEGNSENFSA
jgi:hypothetical protein